MNYSKNLHLLSVSESKTENCHVNFKTAYIFRHAYLADLASCCAPSRSLSSSRAQLLSFQNLLTAADWRTITYTTVLPQHRTYSATTSGNLSSTPPVIIAIHSVKSQGSNGGDNGKKTK